MRFVEEDDVGVRADQRFVEALLLCHLGNDLGLDDCEDRKEEACLSTTPFSDQAGYLLLVLFLVHHEEAQKVAAELGNLGLLQPILEDFPEVLWVLWPLVVVL